MIHETCIEYSEENIIWTLKFKMVNSIINHKDGAGLH